MKVPRLIADEEVGEGYIKLPDGWNEYDPVLKADILKDWLYALNAEYQSSLVQWAIKSVIRKAMK